MPWASMVGRRFAAYVIAVVGDVPTAQAADGDWT
jgi:hypothetical protein